MRLVQLKLSDQDFDRLQTYAFHKAHQSPEAFVRGLVEQFLEKRRKLIDGMLIQDRNLRQVK